jgi:exodeoxyribonuclease VII large subunit
MENFPSFRDLISGNIYKVSQLNSKIKSIIENELGKDYIWLEGEVSNFRGNYSSGHWYFTIKDENSQVSAVCFKWANQHIKFVPEDGKEVVCCGQVNVYEKQGTYQLNIRYIEPKGKGAQSVALEQLKEKLQAEGLFAIEKKRPLPFLAGKIGIATSPTGAAIKDIIKVIGRRFENTEIIISPTRVQGDEAPGEIVQALDLLYRIDDLDLIILARGGGSVEDLWVFNEEILARKISESPVPLISAVGHEIDITIADLVADVRASTPSMAAEIAVREKDELISQLNNFGQRINNSLINRFALLQSELDRLQDRIVWSLRSTLEKGSSELSILAGKLDSLSPLKVLGRGYSIVYDKTGKKVVKSADKLKKGNIIQVRFETGRAKCTVDKTDI